MRPNRIPLFPLEVVLFPGATLPLHIFEQRYKMMIACCLNENREFGVVLAGDKGVVTVGCTASITSKTKDYPDGRMDILTQGRVVFRVLKLVQEKEYHEAVVEYLLDVPAPLHESIDCRETSGLLALFQECHSLIYGQMWVTTGRQPLWPLSYQLAARLPLDLEERQQLLEIRDEPKRQDFLIQWMNALLLPRLANQQRARSTAAGNGHRLN
ncbi:MAG: LON peptidase substrate-binding domain-containing protein [Candidatus Acidiferrales bacterium]